LSERAIIFVVVMGALFSITLGVAAGVKNTPPVYVKAARNMGAHGLSLYSRVIIPAALPTVLSGLKQGWSFAWRSLMAGMVVIMAVGVSCDQLLFAPAERRMRERRGLGS